MMNSVWNNNAIMPSFPALEHDLKTDVLIIGGGMAGILCAHMLEIAGVVYTLIEADRICGGITESTTAKITTQHGLVYHKLLRIHGPEITRKYWQANQAALEMYRKLAQTVDCDFCMADHSVYSKDNLQCLNAEKAVLDSLGIPADFLKTTSLPFSVEGAICFRNQAQFHPLKFAAEISNGLHIYENTPVRDFIGNKVITDSAKITASKIIIATHFPLIHKHGGYFLKMYQQRSYVLALKNARKVDGMYLDAMEEGLSFRNYGDLLLLGGGGHRTGKKGEGWQQLEDFASRYYPSAREVCRWATQDCMTLDHIPYIGQYSRGTPNLFVATGFNKWGMTNSMVAAMLLSDLVQGKENVHASVFSPQRSIWHKQLLCNAWESAINLLTPTKPRCPHMGCALKWNSQEHSWDCPCLGSRFTETGKLLNNPATGNLKQDPKEVNGDN